MAAPPAAATGMSAPAARGSLQARLIAAFLAVAVLPMLASTWFAVHVVSGTFDANVRHWLGETATLFLNVIREAQDEAAGTVAYLVNDGDLVDALVQGRGGLPVKYQQLLGLFGYDLFAIVDERGNIVFSSEPADAILPRDAPVDHLLYQLERGGRTEMLIAGVQPFQRSSRRYRVLLGVRLDENFITHSRLFTSLDLRIYSGDTTGFREFYSSLGAVAPAHALPEDVARELQQGSGERYDAAAERGQYRALYAPIRTTSGALVGALSVGLRNRETLAGPVTQARLFLGVLTIGSLLAIAAAIALARRIATPLRALAQAAEAIAEGDYRTVAVPRSRDEIGELTRRFNQMSERLGRLQELETQLRRRDRLSALGQVGLGIAHEVRNPLGIIRTSTELVQSNPALGEGDARLLGYVIEETVRIDRLISEFLAFARPAPPDLQPLRPAELIERVLAVCEPQLAKAGVRTTLALEAPEALIRGDERQIHAALLNLILNAIDAMPDGGSLTLRQQADAASVRIEVEDSGPGVAAADVEHVFDPFFTTKAQGTGLGLAKAYSTMQGHDGSIEYLGTEGRGALFRLTFPRWHGGGS